MKRHSNIPSFLFCVFLYLNSGNSVSSIQFLWNHNLDFWLNEKIKIKDEEMKRKNTDEREREKEGELDEIYVNYKCVYAFAIGFTKIAHTCTPTHKLSWIWEEHL